MAQALTLFDSRHLLIITSFDSWCGQMNDDLGLQVIIFSISSVMNLVVILLSQLSRHGAPNMSSYIPNGNCTQGAVFLLVAGKGSTRCA
jgi:hypothetical protein